MFCANADSTQSLRLPLSRCHFHLSGFSSIRHRLTGLICIEAEIGKTIIFILLEGNRKMLYSCKDNYFTLINVFHSFKTLQNIFNSKSMFLIMPQFLCFSNQISKTRHDSSCLFLMTKNHPLKIFV